MDWDFGFQFIDNSLPNMKIQSIINYRLPIINYQFGKKGKVLNLGHLYFDIVSIVRCPVEDFVLRISYFAGLRISTTVESSLQIRPFLTNKANFRKSQMNVTCLLTREYEKKDTWWSGKNKANSNPIQSQFKPNSNPIQTQFKPNTNPIQTQNERNLFFKRNYEL